MSVASLFKRFETGSGVLARSSDLILAFVVVAIIGLMILPLPLPMLDTLVALNITIGVMLVLMSIYVSTPLHFSAFPSVLLISTLYRLALSVATTRMILLDGDAGHIIDTFGNLVAGGNIVVGLVVFLIITLVQFLVIAKGAERVAEVGARFTLDAMPGKQMSIDSDLRSGLIDKVEARRKRDTLELESKLHGSMDGAMKFVKGDAVAGIVIIIVNLLGGLAIGVFQHDMSVGAAMQKYSILTIGDGLVAQIPALLGAMSAGLIVTRVSDGSDDKHLGDAIQRQFTAIPRVMMVAGAMCCLFAVIPGFPSGIFLGMGLLLLGTGALLVPALRGRFQRVSQPTFDAVLQRRSVPRSQTIIANGLDLPAFQPLRLQMPAAFGTADQGERLQQMLTGRLNEHRVHSGVPVPPLTIEWHDKEEPVWSFDAYEVPLETGRLDETSTAEQMVDQVLLGLRRNIKLFLDLQETSMLAKEASATSPDVVKEVLRAIPMHSLTTVLRNLAEEEVPLGNLKAVFEGLIRASQNDKDPSKLTEFARMSLARQLCHRYADNGEIRAIALTAEHEEQLMRAVRPGTGTTFLELESSHIDTLTERLCIAIDQHQPAAVVAPVEIRRHLRQMIAYPCFEIPVLSYPEIIKPFTLNIVHRMPVSNASPLRAVGAS